MAFPSKDFVLELTLNPINKILPPLKGSWAECSQVGGCHSRLRSKLYGILLFSNTRGFLNCCYKKPFP